LLNILPKTPGNLNSTKGCFN